MTAKQFELEVLNNNKYVIAEFDKDNYYLDDENSAKSLECRLNELFDENEQLKQQNADWETSLDICKHYKETYSTEIVKIKHTIKTMMENERTELGRSVLRQLWSAIQ